MYSINTQLYETTKIKDINPNTNSHLKEWCLTAIKWVLVHRFRVQAKTNHRQINVAFVRTVIETCSMVADKNAVLIKD